MIKTLMILLAALPLSSQAKLTTEPVPNQTVSKQLLAGTWQFTGANGCTDTVTYHADGTRYVTSQDEIAESIYTVEPVDKKLIHHILYATNNPTSLHPDSPKKRINPHHGVYFVRVNVTKDNGGADCSGDKTDDTGANWQYFYVMNKNNTSFFVCVDFEYPCLGPYKKQPE